MAASLQHPHIVPLLAAGDAGGALYYTMPMVDGESLREVFKREERPAVADVVRILHDVAEALDYAHSRGVVHRDIKPDNVLLVNGAHALVVDFGVAKAITSARDAELPAPHVGDQTLTSQGIALGTPSYMAPEQAAADPNADHRMDIYAVGALGYEMLRGAPLFSGMSPASVLAAQVSKQPEPLEREAHVPESLYAVIERCLAKLPDDRFATAAALAQALEDVNTDLVLRTPTSGGSRVWRHTPTRASITKSRPRWRVFAELAVAFVAIAALGSFVRDGFSRGIVDGTTLRERDEVLVANFADAGSGLGAVVSDALRTDLTQSTLVRVVQPVAVSDALERMQREPTAAVDSSLAREVALREGIPAYVVGDVVSVGRGFQLTARLISADSGLVLAAVRESASDSSEVIGAIDKLSKGLRRILGESMRSLSSAPPLDRVTTPSLEALRRYTQAVAAVDVQGDYPRGYRLLEEAIALDPNFAMAMRKLSAALSNRGQQPERARELLSRAMEHRDRLTPVEAHLLEGSWYSAAGPQRDERRAMAAYDAVIALDSTDKRALNNLAILHMDRGDYARAEVLLRRAVDGSASALQMSNLVEAQAAQGKLVDARATADQFLARFPSHPMAHTASASVAYALGDLDGTERSLLELRRIGDNDLGVRRMADGSLSALLLMRGRLAAADSTIQAYMRADPEIEPRTAMAVETRRAITRALFLGDASGAARQLDAVRAQLASNNDTAVTGNAPLLMLARAYALSGRIERARELLREYRRRTGGNGAADSVAVAITEAEIALQSRDYARAVALVRSFPGFQRCPHCLDGEQARVYDMAGDTDSALVRYSAFVQQFRWSQLEEDVFLFGPALKRLGEMHEERGQKEQAAGYYVRFLDLYTRADRELQPQVEQVRTRLSRLKPV
jgi:serine/threonine-protein kinase